MHLELIDPHCSEVSDWGLMWHNNELRVILSSSLLQQVCSDGAHNTGRRSSGCTSLHLHRLPHLLSREAPEGLQLVKTCLFKEANKSDVAMKWCNIQSCFHHQRQSHSLRAYRSRFVWRVSSPLINSYVSRRVSSRPRGGNTTLRGKRTKLQVQLRVLIEQRWPFLSWQLVTRFLIMSTSSGLMQKSDRKSQ